MENRNTPRPGNLPARPTEQPPNSDFNEDEVSGDRIDTLGVENEADASPGGDIGFDRVVGADEAGLGDGLDQAEEAQLGTTDEELAELTRHLRTPKN